MSAPAAFVLGLIVAWVIEWVIDWIYWRRRMAEQARRVGMAETQLSQPSDLKIKASGQADLENQIAALKTDNAELQQKIAEQETERRNWQDMNASNLALQEKVRSLEAEKLGWQAQEGTRQAGISSAVPDNAAPSSEAGMAAHDVYPASQQPPSVPTPVVPDDLIIIKGIGPVIARKLNDAGIYTFRDLGAITPARLREIVGDAIQRLANEEDILNQARELAAKQDRSVNP